MFSLKQFVLTAAAVICLTSAPSVAFAVPAGVPPLRPQSTQIQASSVPAVRESATPQSFQLDDAGVGAAVMLVLVGLGAVAVVGARRRGNQPLIG
jgi:hypothetical protein